MGRFWDRLIAVFRRAIKAPETPPRRSPWVVMGHLSADPGLRCNFCGKEKGESRAPADGRGEDDFALVQARYNPRLQHIVCSDCLKWNRISSA